MTRAFRASTSIFGLPCISAAAPIGVSPPRLRVPEDNTPLVETTRSTGGPAIPLRKEN